jgi:hypothetical protein
MFDDLREKANDSDYLRDEFDASDGEMEFGTKASPRLFLGMTPAQRFVISVMILLMACVMGSFLLLVTEKIFLPFV